MNVRFWPKAVIQPVLTQLKRKLDFGISRKKEFGDQMNKLLH